MNWVYTICDETFNEYAKILFSSLNKHTNCKILYNYVGPTDEKVQENVKLYNVKESEWTDKIQLCKIKKINEMSENFKTNDRVFVLDSDMIVQDDIFKIFDEFEFDVGYTSRYYKYHYPINAGVWCFKWNKNSKQFLNFYESQILKPSWRPLTDFRKKFKRGKHVNWWVDQDFLCSLYINHGMLPFECKVKDIGFKYNYCPSAPDKMSYDKGKELLKKQVGNKEYKILHFKAVMKSMMKEL